MRAVTTGAVGKYYSSLYSHPYWQLNWPKWKRPFFSIQYDTDNRTLIWCLNDKNSCYWLDWIESDIVLILGRILYNPTGLSVLNLLPIFILCMWFFFLPLNTVMVRLGVQPYLNLVSILWKFKSKCSEIMICCIMEHCTVVWMYFFNRCPRTETILSLLYSNPHSSTDPQLTRHADHQLSTTW